MHTRGTLDADRQHRLQDLPGWSWNPKAAQWEEGFSQLSHYVDHNGHARVPKSYTVDGYKLGQWVNQQRTFHAKGRLDADRERRLEELPGWTWKPIADKWEEGFSRLLEYVERHGDARVPGSYTVDGYRLGMWVIVQRHRRSGLDADREHRLQELPGWTWDRLADMWEEGFRRLQDYVERNGDARVPQSCTVDDYQLGTWVDTQRRRHSKGTLEADRERRLQQLPGWTWDSPAAQWEEGFSRLLDYIERHRDARVPRSYTVDGYRLGAWVSQQRIDNNKSMLDSDRQCRLQELPGWTWNPFADDWQEGFWRLQDYLERNGHAHVPKSYTVDGYKLGQWVGVQRDKHAKGTLDPDRRRRLENLTGWTWDPFADYWEEGLRRLQDYVERNGDARVPQRYTAGGYRLGAWIMTQRNRRSTLDTDRQRRLEKLPGWTWDARADRGRRPWAWEEGFRRLQEYVKHHGDARVPQRYTADGYRLGAWVSNQRQSHRKGTLDADRQHRLQQLPGWTWKACSST